MIKNKIFLEKSIENRIYQFSCDPNCSLGEIYDVLSEMRGYIIQRINESIEQKKDEPKE